MAKQRHQTTSVLLIDHQPLWLDALRRELGGIKDVHVLVGLLNEGLNQDADFDVVVVDPCFHGELNLDLVERAKQRWPEARLVVFCDCADPKQVLCALGAGVHSYILKTEPVETLGISLEAVCRGVAVFSLPVAAVVASEVVAARVPTAARAGLQKGLSPRELEVLQLIARGNSDPEIGEALGISKRTVSRHVTGILNKLSCRTRSQAIASVLGAEPPFSVAPERVA